MNKNWKPFVFKGLCLAYWYGQFEIWLCIVAHKFWRFGIFNAFVKITHRVLVNHSRVVRRVQYHAGISRAVSVPTRHGRVRESGQHLRAPEFFCMRGERLCDRARRMLRQFLVETLMSTLLPAPLQPVVALRGNERVSWKTFLILLFCSNPQRSFGCYQ